MADLARLSVAHFSKCFKKSFGSTPREYLVQIRLQHAKTLMMGTGLSLSRIALDCGFCDQPHFCRTFQQAFGWTPNHWRKVNMPDFAV